MGLSPDTKVFMQRLVDVQTELFCFVATALGPDKSDVGDVVQETNRALIEHADDYDASRPFVPWAVAFAKRQILCHYKRCQRDRLVFDEELVARFEQAYARQDEAELRESPLARRLAFCLGKLSLRQRRLVALRYNGECPIEEIARQTGSRPTAVRASLFYIRKKLAECIERLCRLGREEFDEAELTGFDELLSEAIEGQAGPEALGELVPRMKASERCVESYLAQMRVHALLSRRCLPGVCALETGKQRSETGGRKEAGRAWWRLAAAAAAVAVGIAMWRGAERVGREALAIRHRPPQAVPQAREPKPLVLVETVRASGVQGGFDRETLEAGNREVFTEMALKKGRYMFRLETGVCCCLVGPAALEFLDDSTVLLRQGTLLAEVPPEAVSFVVDTPMVRVRDLGTRFGVSVQASGATDVMVAKGRVFAEGVSGRPAKMLMPGWGVRVDGAGRHQFLRASGYLPESLEEWQEWISAKADKQEEQNMRAMAKGVVTLGMTAALSAVALNTHAGDGVWNRVDNTNVVSPALWSEASNWADGVIAGGEGSQAAFTNAFPDKVYRAVEVPPEGVALGRLWFRNIADGMPVWDGAFMHLSGGPIRMQGSPPRIDSSADQLWIFSELQGSNGLSTIATPSVNLFADSSYTGLTTVEAGYWITRFDGVADSSDPVLRDYASTDDFVLNGGRLSFYGRRATTATVTSNWELAAGKTLATYVSGSNAGALTPGAPVAGPGLPEGTFVRRIINSTSILLSAPATASGSPVALVFSPVPSECYQSIRSVACNHDNSEFVLNKNNAHVLRVEVGELRGTGNVSQRVSPGQASGILAFRNTRSYGGHYSLNAGHLELLKDGDIQPVFSKLTVVADSTLGVPEADAVASLPWVFGAGTTLTKTGAGTLSLGVGFSSTLSLVVKEGVLALPLRLSVETLLAEASLRLDASRADTLTLDAEGRVSRWADADGRANALTNGVPARQPVRVPDALNGLPVVDFGPYYGSAAGCGLFLEGRKTGVRSAFVVYEGRHPDAVLLGEAPGIGTCAYTRSLNTANAVWSANTAQEVRTGSTALDGAFVNGAAAELTTNAFHVVSSVVNGSGVTTVGALGNDRNYRSGGQRIAEVILFDRKLSPAEQAAVDDYLLRKWLAADAPRRMADVTLENGARLVLPSEETLEVRNLALQGEVWLEGPGQVRVTGGITQSGTVHFVNGGGLAVTGVGGTLEAAQPVVADAPAFWVDACALTNAGAPGVVLENGTNFVTRWNDMRGEGCNFATNITLRPVLRLNDVNGLPSVAFRRVNAVPSQSEALFWDQPLNDIRAVFMVVGSQEGGGILLGSSAAQNTQDFYRNAWVDPGRPIFNASGTGAAQALLNGPFYLNGNRINPAATGYNGLFQLVEAYPTGPVRASAFAGDRNTANGNGCQRLCEVILYNRELTAQEQVNTAEYLMRKWFGRGTPRGGALQRVGSVSADGGGTLDVAGETDYLSVERYAGSGDVVKTGDGTLVLKSVAVADGALDVRAGTVRLEAGDPRDRLPTGAFLHVDASQADTLVFNPAKGPDAVERWNDCRGGANFVRRRANDDRRPCPVLVNDTLNELPVIDFGELKTGNPDTPLQCFFEWDQACSNVCDAFAVIGSEAGGNTVLGTKSGGAFRHFNRTVNADFTRPLLTASAALQLRMGEARLNGAPVTATAAGLSGGFDLVSFSAYGNGVYADAFANDAYGATGGQKLGEALVYDRPLGWDERMRVEAYLLQKWFGVTVPGYEPTEVGRLAVAAGARVEIDGALAVDGLAGAGTVGGDLTLRDGAVVTVAVAGGGLSVLTVEGRLTLEGGGTVALTGDVDSLTAGRYPFLGFGSLAGGGFYPGQWTVAGAPERFGASLKSGGGQFAMQFMPKGTILTIR
jgi:RNA polymerase sigma-70 factor (ECF subfamily)